jgi:acetyltransferase-like isoleucine patch superfamily enzyme
MLLKLLTKVGAIQRDPRARIMSRLEVFAQDGFSLLDSALCRLLACAWGIRLGPSCRFYGITQFRRYPESTIRIGANCAFRSAFRSNLVGLNHSCAISTYTQRAIILIGDRSGLSSTSISAAASIRIGNHVLCGANVVITDFDWHDVDPAGRLRGHAPQSAPIVIGDNVWLGMNTVVLKGVLIGENSVIGANSVVTRSLPANTVAAGAPARVIRHLEQD